MDENHFWNLLAKKLSGEASEEEVHELASLINNNAQLSYSAQHLTDMWKVEQPSNNEEAETAYQKHCLVLQNVPVNAPPPEILESEPARNLKRKWIFFFVFILMAVGLAYFIFILPKADNPPTNSFSDQIEEIYTRPGTKNKLVLPDGSIVWLNADSKLSYSKPFGVKDRVVTLSGEGYFNVVKDQKPFIIHTSGIHIKVLGTVFNVRNYPNEKKIETSLVSGQVEITLDKSPEKKYTLKKNEKLTLHTGEAERQNKKTSKEMPLALVSTIHYLDESTIAETSWVENKLVFADESFDAIAKKMERWYGIKIHFKNEKIKAEHFTGVFDKETVWQALQAMQMISAFEFQIKDDEIIITQ